MEKLTDTSLPRSLELARDVSTVVVSASLLLGVSFLTGTCAALGSHTFGYLTATDIAEERSARKPVAGLSARGRATSSHSNPCSGHLLSHSTYGRVERPPPVPSRVVRYSPAVPNSRVPVR